MHKHAFRCQRSGELGFGTVIAMHFRAMQPEITGQGRHANAANADEIDFFNCVEFHVPYA